MAAAEAVVQLFLFSLSLSLSPVSKLVEFSSLPFEAILT